MNINDILNGAQLIVSVNGTVEAFATSCSISFTTNTSEVATKEFGKYPGKVLQTVEWEVTTENLCGNGNFANLLKLLQTKAGNNTPVQIVVGQSQTGDWNDGKGTVTRGAQGDMSIGSFKAPTAWFTGYAYITSLSANAAVGDNATMSATFTGVGALEKTQATQVN